VHVARDVEVVGGVEGEGDVVVGVPDEGAGQALEGPIGGVEPALGDGHAAFGVVVGGELKWGVGEEGEADGVGGPDGLEIEGAGCIGGVRECHREVAWDDGEEGEEAG
jgi:hypothetical protein